MICSLYPSWQHQAGRWFWLLLITALAVMLMPEIAEAGRSQCTTQASSVANQSQAGGIITSIMKVITDILTKTSEGLYTKIIGHPNYTQALGASVMLTVIVYGVMVVFDLANLKPGEVVTRLFKLGLVMWIASPGGWQLIDGLVMKFFMGGMTELVNLFLLGAVQNSPWGSGTGGVQFDAKALGQPLAILSGPVAQLFGSKYAVTILGLFSMAWWQWSGTAFFMALVLIWAGWNVMLALFNAIFVYVKSLVGLWFLMALSPIFIIFVLYQTTRDLFQGWLNMVINFALQPVLLFAFFSFFLVMVSASMANIFNTEWCLETVDTWIPWVTLDVWYPSVVMLPNGTVWNVPEGTKWLVTGANTNPAVQFPIQILDVLFLLLSSYLGLQYASFVPQLTTQLSRNGLALGATLEDTRQFFNARGWTPEAWGAAGVNALGSGMALLGRGASSMVGRIRAGAAPRAGVGGGSTMQAEGAGGGSGGNPLRTMQAEGAGAGLSNNTRDIANAARSSQGGIIPDAVGGSMPRSTGEAVNIVKGADKKDQQSRRKNASAAFEDAIIEDPNSPKKGG